MNFISYLVGWIVMFLVVSFMVGVTSIFNLLTGSTFNTLQVGFVILSVVLAHIYIIDNIKVYFEEEEEE